jgi:hypothetical protein
VNYPVGAAEPAIDASLRTGVGGAGIGVVRFASAGWRDSASIDRERILQCWRIMWCHSMSGSPSGRSAQSRVAGACSPTVVTDGHWPRLIPLVTGAETPA